MCYDEWRDKVVLFGGYDAGPFWSGYAADTWEHDGTSWSLRTITWPSTPSYRSGHGLAFDSFRGKSVMYGGSHTGSDTFEWDGSSWEMSPVPGVSPSGRENHITVWQRHNRALLIFGGSGAGIPGLIGETWEFFGGLQHQESAYGAGCGSPALQLLPSAFPPLIGTTAHATIGNTAGFPAIIFLGWSNTDYLGFFLPASLGAYGYTGCFLLQSADASFQASPASANTADFAFPIPDQGPLIGLRVYFQACAVRPSAPGQLVFSNGLDWRLGNS